MDRNITDKLTTIIPKIIKGNVNNVTFSWYDYILFSTMLTLSAFIGIYFGCFGTKQSTADEYLMGNKKMKVFPISMSLIASHISGITLLAVPADVYRFGASYWLLAIAALFVTVITIYVFLPVFYKLQITSTYEYLERRFDNKNRMFASFLFALSLFLYLPIVIYIPALAFSAATGINVHFITPLVCGVCIFYTTIGGLKAVVWTDTLQFTVTIGAVITVFFMGVKSAGGFQAVWNNAVEGHRLDIFDFDLDPTKRDSFWITLIGITFGWLQMAGINQSSVQKFLSVSTLTGAKLTILYFNLGMTIVTSFSVFTGLIMYSKYSKCDPFTTGQVERNDQLLPYYVMDVASQVPGLSGLFIAGVFCAGLSTLSAYLNCLSGTIYEDFIVKMFGNLKAKNASYTLKLTVVIIGVICAALVFVIEHLGGILPLAFSLSGVTAGPLLGMFTLGVLFPRASSKGTFYGGIAGMVITSWIVFMAQYYKSQGLIHYEPKPTSIEGCLSTTLINEQNVTFSNYSATTESFNIVNSTDFMINQTTPNTNTEEKGKPFYLFRISYYYYTPLACFITMIVCLLISYCTKNTNPPIDRDLLCPLIYRFLPEEEVNAKLDITYYSVNKALNLVNTNNKDQ